jgi:hypothetical protein
MAGRAGSFRYQGFFQVHGNARLTISKKMRFTLAQKPIFLCHLLLKVWTNVHPDVLGHFPE